MGFDSLKVILLLNASVALDDDAVDATDATDCDRSGRLGGLGLGFVLGLGLRLGLV